MTNFGRISGIASGFDTETIISDMMRVQRMPVDRLMQQRQILEWQRDDYREINRAILAFRNNFSFNMRLQSTFLAKAAVSNNENVLTAASTTKTQDATYHVEVSKLAEFAYNNSSAGISADGGDKIDAGANLWSQLDKFDNWETIDVADEKINVTGKNKGKIFHLDQKFAKGELKVRVDTSEGEYKVYYTKAEFNASGEKDKVLVDRKTGQLTFAKDIAQGATISVDYSYYSNKFSVTTYPEGQENTTEYTLDLAKDSLNSVLAAINSDKDLGLTAYYDESSDKVSLATIQAGKHNQDPEGLEIKIEGFLGEALKIAGENERGGTDAVLTVNGLEITRSSNEFTLNEVNFNLKETGTATVTVTGDTDKVVQSITDFVNEYNKVLLQLNEKLSEERHRDYPPLTDQQRDQLSDRQIEQWEEMSRTGHLRNDTLLRTVVTELRTALTSRVTGAEGYSSLAAIGITTGDYREQGILHVDENKLRGALKSDPEAVMKLFTAEGSGNADGVGKRVDESLKNSLDRLTEKAGNPDSLLFDNSVASRSIRDINSQIDRLEERLERVEERYWRQFVAMEQALSKMYAQSDWLAQQMMGLMGQ
ncbi:MAG: flagellar filament capping protein FliD [Desulfotomaculaceae bacterium]